MCACARSVVLGNDHKVALNGWLLMNGRVPVASAIVRSPVFWWVTALLTLTTVGATYVASYVGRYDAWNLV